MNLNPDIVIGPVFHFLDETIADYGVYLYLVLVWMSLILIAWIIIGGLCNGSNTTCTALLS